MNKREYNETAELLSSHILSFFGECPPVTKLPPKEANHLHAMILARTAEKAMDALEEFCFNNELDYSKYAKLGY